MKVNIKKMIFKVGLLFVLVIGIITAVGLFQNRDSIYTSNIVSERVLIPGGQSVGIEMDVKGALIVGVENNFGPKVGDMIVKVGDKKVDSAKDVENLICDTNNTINIKVIRKGREHSYNVKPVFDKQLNKYKLGLWVKEKIAGIGTLSFYDSKTGKYAALGHGIYESKSKTLLKSKKGNLIQCEINNIKEGEEGTPGELAGVFYNCDTPIGTIDRNSPYGIYGSTNTNALSLDLNQPMIMATQSQVEEGKAYIYTTISGRKVERFTIEITDVHYQRKASSRGIEFKVTDTRLIKRCGGIIQGMSGSPIIQNNRIVGAVTHVLVDQPLKGYGIFASWMIEEIDKIG